MKGTLGYGRYDDDPDCVGCPRAQSDMTPCVARDGALALADDGVCVGCDQKPSTLLVALIDVSDRAVGAGDGSETYAADALRDLVKEVTEP